MQLRPIHPPAGKPAIRRRRLVETLGRSYRMLALCLKASDVGRLRIERDSVGSRSLRPRLVGSPASLGEMLWLGRSFADVPKVVRPTRQDNDGESQRHNPGSRDGT